MVIGMVGAAVKAVITNVEIATDQDHQDHVSVDHRASANLARIVAVVATSKTGATTDEMDGVKMGVTIEVKGLKDRKGSKGSKGSKLKGLKGLKLG